MIVDLLLHSNFLSALFSGRILWSNEWFYKESYEDQICLSWPNESACQFS